MKKTDSVLNNSKFNTIVTLYLPILAWMILIFLFSNQIADDSNSMSLGISGYLYKLLERFNIDSILSYDMMNHYIRKLAHFSIYLILGILMIRPFYIRELLSITQKLLISLIFCSIYAASDEFHQSFIPGRAMMITDVLIDTLGALVGIIIYIYFLNPLASKCFHKHNKQ